MSLKQDRAIKKLQAETEFLKSEIKRLDARDEEMIKTVMFKAMAIYLENEVDFSMSTEGKIKEILDNE